MMVASKINERVEFAPVIGSACSALSVLLKKETTNGVLCNDR